MARPAQKLTTVPLSTVDVGDRISYDFPVKRGLDVSHVGTVHRRTFENKVLRLETQEGETIISWSTDHATEPRVYMLQRAPKVQPALELFNYV